MPFHHASHPEMIAKSAAVTLTPEKYAYLVSLVTTPEAYSEAHKRFEASFTASLAAKGDPEKLKACEEARNALNQCLAIIAGVAKAVTVKDPTVPDALGLARALEKPTAPAAALPEPHDFKVVYDPNGQLLASVTRVPTAKAYQIWACAGDPNIEANWKLVASSTNCRGIEIPGLNRAMPNWLKIRAIRGKTVGPWSNCVSLNPS